MRALFTALILAVIGAGPALAQDANLSAYYEAMWHEQQAANRMAQQRSVALENQVGALEAQMQTETRLRDLEGRLVASRLPATDATQAAPPAVLPANIDAWMAESNARVRAAATNRR
ncbi:MAG: hypothetical protein Q8N10_18710 [Phenylobacterium sp.]|uniref:hypothetical protein n=1 Tax=Phenylobacterium sp. TaxID=1871053 RepID=UPI002725D2FA|nr:hypothetical protein [Phenylobacterium sp.]MDO8910869.1 hypothetical protein [Phenylobacterium sp.]MDP3102523.1 hypothetical protein [Phenylobacterium sp.]